MKRKFVYILKILLILGITTYLTLLILLTLFQKRFIFVPSTEQTLPQTVGLSEFKIIYIPTADGEKLVTWYKKPEKNGKTILFFHGNGGALANYSRIIHELKANADGFLAIDYRGYGGSTGTPSAKGLYTDAMSALQFLKKEGVTTEQIIVVGYSIGSGLAVQVASQNDIAALILFAPYSSLEDIAKNRFPYLPVQYLLTDNIDALALIKNVRAPLLVMHGLRDNIIPYWIGKKLYDAASTSKKIILLEDEGHGFPYQTGNLTSVKDFLNEKKLLPEN